MVGSTAREKVHYASTLAGMAFGMLLLSIKNLGDIVNLAFGRNE
ncbi:MAG: hypothetical protein Nk1A_1240 [Endomicrobiia bacterium]|nr:MAG: hypothetical protein Nk1A_1240 [Endomicrobiia bacterium]